MKWLVLLAGIAAALPAEAYEPALPDAEATWSVGASPGASGEPWWVQLGDPQLEAFVEAGIAANPDVAAARDRVLQAKAVAGQAMSGFLPSVSVDSTASASRNLAAFQLGLDEDEPGAGSIFADQPDTIYSGSLAVTGSTNLDIWGRAILQWRAGQSEAEAGAGDRDGLAMEVSRLVAEAYLDVVMGAERVALVEAQVANSHRLLEAVELRYERGDATALDVLQQRQQEAATAAQLPLARQGLAIRRQTLATLIGQPAYGPLPETAQRLPVPSETLDLGRPSDLVDHRPDLRSSRDRWTAARRRFMSATRVFLPALGISGSAGTQWQDRGSFSTTGTWNAGASVSVPIFNGGANIQGVRAARATRDAQARTLEADVLGAIGEVEGALVAEQTQRELLAAIERQTEAARLMYQEARSRYVAGIAPFVNVTTALDALQRSELSLLQTRRDLVSTRIQLHDALGGPWTVELAARGGSR